MRDPIAELLKSPIPEKLWHYTSIQGFHGIVTSKEIFATDLRFLNDRQEFAHLKKITEELVAELPVEEPSGLRARKVIGDLIASDFKTGLLSPARLQLFVASFSAAKDQLGQWRGYSHGSSGVSLAFALNTFRPSSEVDTLVSFAPCVYDTAKQKELVRHALRPFKDEIEGHWNKAFKKACDLRGREPVSNRYEFVKNYLNDHRGEFGSPEEFVHSVSATRTFLAKLAALLKDPAFAEEEEWRLVLPMWVEAQTPVTNPPRYRVGKTTLIPYIAYPFQGPLPLVDVVLGPGSDENACSAAQRFLRSNGIDLVPRPSSVPYRSL